MRALALQGHRRQGRVPSNYDPETRTYTSSWNGTFKQAYTNNPEAWNWYYTTVGKERCPIVDTWWQTETRVIEYQTGGALSWD